jgi:hypothetical protein
MAKTLQFKRYTTSVLANTTGANGELIVDSNTNSITVHDGSKSGGWYTANAITLQSAFNTANAAYAQSNTNLNYLASNVAIILGIDVSQNSTINLAFAQANAAFVAANASSNVTTLSYAQANAAFVAANASSNVATLSYAQANGAFLTANASSNVATLSYAQANASFLVANTPSNVANLAYAQANASFAAANSAATTIPQNRQSSNYVLNLTDAGKHLYYETSSNSIVYIPDTSSVVFSNGQTVMIVSRTSSSANIIVSPNASVSLYAAGNTISGDHNVTSYGVATLMQVSANTWFIAGTGVV